MTDPTNDRMDQAGVPMSDEEEMELRGRMTVLEQRVGIIFWLALLAELGVLALGIALIVEARKAKT